MGFKVATPARAVIGFLFVQGAPEKQSYPRSPADVAQHVHGWKRRSPATPRASRCQFAIGTSRSGSSRDRCRNKQCRARARVPIRAASARCAYRSRSDPRPRYPPCSPGLVGSGPVPCGAPGSLAWLESPLSCTDPRSFRERRRCSEGQGLQLVALEACAATRTNGLKTGSGRHKARERCLRAVPRRPGCFPCCAR